MNRWLRFLGWFLLMGGLYASNSVAQNVESHIRPLETGVISLEQCQKWAAENYPLIAMSGLIERTTEFTIDNVRTSFLPQVSLAARLSYQSDVTSMSFAGSGSGFGFSPLSKDQYQASLEATQLIWDGGRTKAQKAIVLASEQVTRKKVEVDIYALRSRVNQMYFGILLADQQLKINELFDSSLAETLARTEGAFRNGTASASDVDILKVELLSQRQKATELKLSRQAYMDMLSLLAGRLFASSVQLTEPQDKLWLANRIISRPELDLFSAQRNVFDTQMIQISAKNKPTLGAFAQLGYGRPGLNMLKNEFSGFYLGGFRLSWPLSGLYTQSNDRKLLQLKSQEVDVQENMFRLNTNIDLSFQEREVSKWAEVAASDREIVALRERVRKASEAKYLNGVIAPSDLIRDLNAENRSRCDESFHRLQRLLAQYQFGALIGKE